MDLQNAINICYYSSDISKDGAIAIKGEILQSEAVFKCKVTALLDSSIHCHHGWFESIVTDGTCSIDKVDLIILIVTVKRSVLVRLQ